LASRTRLIGSPFVAEKTVIRIGEYDIDIGFPLGIESLRDGLAMLRCNVLVEPSQKNNMGAPSACARSCR
jgi:hypothetical protein